MPNEITIDGVRYYLVPLDEQVEAAKAESASAARPAPGRPWTVRDVARARGVLEKTIRREVARKRIRPMRPTVPYTFEEREAKRYLGMTEGGR